MSWYEDCCPDCGEDRPRCRSCDPFAPCEFCGDVDCDGSGYNCADDHYETYNEQGIGVSGVRDPGTGS